MALLADNKQIAIVGSHEHGRSVGMMTVSEEIQEFIAYLQTTGPLNGYNFSPLAVDN